MNNLDKDYQALLQDILDNGVTKQDRTGTGTISVFGRQIRHNMKDGFPLLTTKKMAWKQIVTELIWFLRGDTNIKYLVDNGCHIWDGDAYKRYYNAHPDAEKTFQYEGSTIETRRMTQDEFIDMIKTDDEFAKKWGELGPVYGKQWRRWPKFSEKVYTKQIREVPEGGRFAETRNVNWVGGSEVVYIDQIQNLINDLKTNPDSRRLMVNAWNVGELDQMVLPPCHYGFQVYTRELNFEERLKIANMEKSSTDNMMVFLDYISVLDEKNIPKRAISLMWNQRSVDTFLGLPFNIASYGLLLEIIAKAVNMVPDQLIGNLGDTHLYLNHIEQAKEQIGRELSLDERMQLWQNQQDGRGEFVMECLDVIPKRTREPYPLPKLNINTEFWQTESGECGVGPLNTNLYGLEISDFTIENYQSHPTIKAPLSN